MRKLKSPMIIPDKQTFMELQNRCLTGPYFRQWKDKEQALEECETGFIYIRGPYPGWKYMVPWCAVKDLSWALAQIEWQSRRTWDYTFVEVPPPGAPRTINGELAYGERLGVFNGAVKIMPIPGNGHYLRWSNRSDLSLRHDLEQNGQEIQGYRAWRTLDTLVKPEDHALLRDLLDVFPGAVIEFSNYERSLPVAGGGRSNLVVWEVRHYVTLIAMLGASLWQSLVGLV